MLEATPAPASTTISCLPLAASFLTVSGVAATRVSPTRVSRGMPIIMVIVPLRRCSLLPLSCHSAAAFSEDATSGNRRGDRLAELHRRRLAPEIGRARRRSIGERRLERAHDRRCRIGMTEMLEHQRPRPDLPDRIGDALAGDVRRGAVYRLERRWK